MTAHSEREWILIGIAECCAAKGYEATTVDDVCAAAGVSRESFDALFADKGECLGAAMESIVSQASATLEGATSQSQPWAANLRDGVAALLALFAARPTFAHLALIEAPLAGGRAAVLHASARTALLDFLERGREHAADPGIPAAAARGALAGVESLAICHQIEMGGAAQLDALAPDLIYMLAVPFLGVSDAGRLAAGSTRRRHLRAVA